MFDNPQSERPPVPVEGAVASRFGRPRRAVWRWSPPSRPWSLPRHPGSPPGAAIRRDRDRLPLPRRPSDAADRPGADLIVRNQGRNVHNVTIPALGISRDVRPVGRSCRLDRGPARPRSLRALLPDPPGGVRHEGRDRHRGGVSRRLFDLGRSSRGRPYKDRRAEEPLDPLTPSPYASVVYSAPRPVKRWPQATRTPGNRRLLRFGGTLRGLAPSRPIHVDGSGFRLPIPATARDRSEM